MLKMLNEVSIQVFRIWLLILVAWKFKNSSLFTILLICSFSLFNCKMLLVERSQTELFPRNIQANPVLEIFLSPVNVFVLQLANT